MLNNWGGYSEEILKIGNWSLRRKNGGELTGNYLTMIEHDCPLGENILRNGEGLQRCSRCKETIPNEIWGLWQLACNDQQMGFKPR